MAFDDGDNVGTVTLNGARRITTPESTIGTPPQNGSYLVIDVTIAVTAGSVTAGLFSWRAQSDDGRTFDVSLFALTELIDSDPVTAGRHCAVNSPSMLLPDRCSSSSSRCSLRRWPSSPSRSSRGSPRRPHRPDGTIEDVWSLVVPVKRLAMAKSRLGDTTHTPGLALAFALDTVAAALETPAVARVVVVTDDDEVAAAVTALGAAVRPDVRSGGLNAAVLSGAAYCVGLVGTHPVASLPSDLPAVTASDLGAALAAAGAHRHAFVADAEGAGTTLLAALHGDLDPRYGPGSAAAHRLAGAVPLRAVGASLRQDVDTDTDLHTARELGVGRATAAALALTPGLCGGHPRSPHQTRPCVHPARASSGDGQHCGSPA